MKIVIACTAAALTLTAAGCTHPTESPPPSSATANAKVICPKGLVPPSESPDCYFLYMMSRNNWSGPSAEMISEAHSACGRMESDGGADPAVDVAIEMHRKDPALTVARAALFTGLAAAAYCPSVIRH
jgi:Protein of unknown function (DUF732)